ncbi:hypothetical protein IAU59_006312 [Kwoniella sp. CBS 9459]
MSSRDHDDQVFSAMGAQFDDMSLGSAPSTRNTETGTYQNSEFQNTTQQGTMTWGTLLTGKDTHMDDEPGSSKDMSYTFPDQYSRTVPGSLTHSGPDHSWSPTNSFAVDRTGCPDTFHHDSRQATDYWSQLDVERHVPGTSQAPQTHQGHKSDAGVRKNASTSHTKKRNAKERFSPEEIQEMKKMGGQGR